MAKARPLFERVFLAINLLLWLFFLLVLLISFTPLNDYMLRPLHIGEELRQAEVIVVLGGGIDRGRFLSPQSAQRLIRGAQLYYAGWAPKILFAGGDTAQIGIPEALVFAQEARKLRIPEQDILVEKNAHHTREQVLEIKKMAAKNKWQNLLIVTSYIHMKRALLAFENLGLKVYPAPADPYEKYAHHPLVRLQVFGQIIREYGAIIYYKARGWI
ncbi:MAG: YdcF family protein [Thermodesulfobacteriota bacterium]